MAFFYRYRKNGGEVRGEHNGPSAPDGWADTWFGVYQQATQYFPPAAPSVPPTWSDGAAIRDATAPEIAAFPQAEIDDAEDMDRERTKALVNDRRMERIMLKFLRKVYNYARDKHGDPPVTYAQVLQAFRDELDNE